MPDLKRLPHIYLYNAEASLNWFQAVISYSINIELIYLYLLRLMYLFLCIIPHIYRLCHDLSLMGGYVKACYMVLDNEKFAAFQSTLSVTLRKEKKFFFFCRSLPELLFSFFFLHKVHSDNMLITRSSLPLKRSVSILYSRRCLLHTTSTRKEHLKERQERPKEYELRVGYGK